MAYSLDPDFSAGGVAVLEDSGDIPINTGQTVKGLTGLIVYKMIYYTRSIIVEFRSVAAKNTFLSSIANDNKIDYAGNEYVISNISLVEQFGNGNLGIWTYSVEMVRD